LAAATITCTTCLPSVEFGFHSTVHGAEVSVPRSAPPSVPCTDTTSAPVTTPMVESLRSRAAAGLMIRTDGASLPVNGSFVTAAPASTRPYWKSAFAPTVVLVMESVISPALASGLAVRMSAAIPATSGAAKDVPSA
jgi:hypothetical protein